MEKKGWLYKDMVFVKTAVGTGDGCSTTTTSGDED